MFLKELETKLSCKSNHNQSRVDFHQFHMVFYQIQQAGNEEYQSLKKWNSVGWKQGSWNSSRRRGNSELRYA